MATTADSEWSAFHQAALGRPPRELLVRTLNFFAVEHRPPGVAVDLGAGSGPDTVELLRRGWHVHAVDSDPEGLELLRQRVPVEKAGQLQLHAARMEGFEFPACDLIWAGFTLPFCTRDQWPLLVGRAKAALRPGGRFAGDLFGDLHAWASEPDVLALAEHEARSALAPLTIEAFDIENGYRVSGESVTRWHAYGFAARKA